MREDALPPCVAVGAAWVAMLTARLWLPQGYESVLNEGPSSVTPRRSTVGDDPGNISPLV